MTANWEVPEEAKEVLRRGSTVHDLKSRPENFVHIRAGRRRFDIRSTADRNFKVGDAVLFHECYEDGTYTGENEFLTISYILPHKAGAGCAAEFGLNPGYVILGLEDWPNATPTD